MVIGGQQQQQRQQQERDRLAGQYYALSELEPETGKTDSKDNNNDIAMADDATDANTSEQT